MAPPSDAQVFPVAQSTALIVIDMQERYRTTAAPRIRPEINATAVLLRRLGLGPVIFMQRGSTPDSAGDKACGLGALRRVSSGRLRATSPPVDEQDRLLSELDVRSGDFLVDKLGDDVFGGSSLAEQLKLARVTSVILAGVVTEACCEATVRSALAHSFQVKVLADGTACPTPYAHEAMLAKLRNSGLAEVSTGMDLRNCFRSMGARGELGTTLQTLQRALSEVINNNTGSSDSECEAVDGAVMSWGSPLAEQCSKMDMCSGRKRRSAEELRTRSRVSSPDLGCITIPVIRSERLSSWMARRWKGTPMLRA